MNKFASIFRKTAEFDTSIINVLQKYSQLSELVHNFTVEPTEELAEEIQNTYDAIIDHVNKIGGNLEYIANIIYENEESEKEEYEVKKNEDGSL